ncbi:unnamed protein product [Rotaria sp. Silwood1]|nr:unnamed protein product [Rotaria sp. Silwood1]CAF1109919.1 unnamed protein product [Rotaria sp. Silwood1]CAF3398618.1 unnamed protein product [Rotaria sp. Silwood1]CAF4580086.1 unnamed protein product [Rotaria sp. Silwood1]CAF4623862.1 unnamed protein product [Rotaria sp. Silwood1]
MINEDLSYFIDDSDEDYDEDSSTWNYEDWLASSIETSADFNQFFDNDLVRLTSLSPPNSTLPLDSLSASSNSLPSDSSSSPLIYSFIDLADNCISPALSQLVNQLYWILLFCCLFRLLCLSKLLSSRKLHYIQVCSSIFILFNYFHFQSIYLLTYILMGYLSFQVCLNKCRNYLTYIIVCFSIIYVLACEFILIEQEKWHSIRGVQMCIMMKMISLAVDYDFFEKSSTLNTSESIICPTTIEFFSYILSIHNTIFGPWINYRNYIRHFHENNPIRKIDFFELAKWTYYFLRMAICLLVSTCLTDWFLRNSFSYNDEQDNNQSGWRIAYIQALSYRFSHYCVCFIGELCGQISGLEFHIDEYRNYTYICQQAKERIDTERKSREQAELEAIAAASDMHTGKRRHRNKKNSNKQEDPEGIVTTTSEEHNDSSQINTILENGSSATVEPESPINDESDISVNRTLVNRRNSKKSLSHNPLPVSSKRKTSIRSNLSNSSSSSLPIKSTISSSLPLSNNTNSSSIVKPSHIEIPHSLVDVVVNWNLPMHYWLKIYVYIPIKQQYGHFSSILVTYLASALLHGFNFQLSIVLFSIGLFAYVEYGFRRKLANILDACVGARTCPLRSSCEKHTHTYWHPLTIIVNVFLCLLSLWHLTYLGQLFDGSSQETIGYTWQHVLDKWSRLNFASHLVVIGTYAIFRSL